MNKKKKSLQSIQVFTFRSHSFKVNCFRIPNRSMRQIIKVIWNQQATRWKVSRKKVKNQITSNWLLSIQKYRINSRPPRQIVLCLSFVNQILCHLFLFLCFLIYGCGCCKLLLFNTFLALQMHSEFWNLLFFCFTETIPSGIVGS